MTPPGSAPVTVTVVAASGPFLVTVAIGLESPPFGLALFVRKGVVPHVPLSDIFKAQIPFLAIDVFAMLLIMTFPIIACGS